MTIDSLVLEVPDPAASDLLHKALGVDHLVTTVPATSPSEGFRGFTLSLVCKQPADVDLLVEAGLDAGATVLKPAAKSFWGYGAVLQAPDGTVWKLAASSKKNTGPASPAFEHLVLLLGVDDVKATKQFYVDQGFEVQKSYGGKYAELVSEPVDLALYPRKAAAKDAGVDPAGSGSHRLVKPRSPTPSWRPGSRQRPTRRSTRARPPSGSPPRPSRARTRTPSPRRSPTPSGSRTARSTSRSRSRRSAPAGARRSPTARSRASSSS